MEDIGPEGIIKRQRLDSAGNSLVQRMQQHPPHSSYGQHTATQIMQLQSPAYAASLNASQQQQQQQQQHQHQHPQPIPPSPYADTGNLADQSQQHYAQPVSGYSTPSRDVRPPFPESGVPTTQVRRESSSVQGSVARSPSDVQQQLQHTQQHPHIPQHAHVMRAVSTEFSGQDYAQPFVSGPGGHPSEMMPVDPGTGTPYLNHDTQQPNGSYQHLPMTQAPPPPSGPHSQHGMPNAGGQPSLGHQSHIPAPYGDPTAMQYPPNAYTYNHGLAQPSQVPQGQKRNARATQACEACRTRKAKCDEGKPACGHCKENNIECKYKDVPPPKAERAQKDLMDKFAAIQSGLSKVQKLEDAMEAMEGMQQRMLEMLQAICDKGAGSFGGQPTRPVSHGLRPSAMPSEPRKLKVSGVNDLNVEEKAGGPIIVAHNTGAHRLLRWAKVRELLRGFPVDENYVMKHEESKGVLHYYGKGQSQDRYDGSVLNTPATPGTPATVASGDSSLSPNLWGTDLGRPFLTEGNYYSNAVEHLGGLNPDGTLNLERATMERLMDRYLDNVHIMHPFIDKGNLRQMVYHVCRQANPGSTNIQSPFLHNLINMEPQRPQKRKFSADLQDPGTPGATRNTQPGTHNQEPIQPLERRISTAIVLLVMALGKICEYTAPLPGPVPESTTETPVPSKATMAAPSTVPTSVKAESPASGESPYQAGSNMASPTSMNDRLASSSTTSVTANQSAAPQDANNQRRMRSGDKNVDVIPGLAYYIRAVEILGLLHGGNELSHAQAFLMASLYASQLACVLESWAWLQNACRVARFLVRADYLAQESIRDPNRSNIMRFVFFTALQLEGDITAELDVQSSGIHQLHRERLNRPDEIPYPADVADNSEQITENASKPGVGPVKMFYSYQLSMRNILNDIQEHLYPKDGKANLRTQEHFEVMLTHWRNSLHDDIKWTDDAAPAKDINTARLRAKYYGARYIVHRLSLYHALQQMTKEDWPPGFWDTTENGVGEDHDPMCSEEAANFELTEAQEKIYNSCEMCIKSAMHSTVAFDGVCMRRGRVAKRLIVTNIFGTAHAQFGNMIVLSAVYKSYLSSLVERKRLLDLLVRTMNFLRSLSPISSTLATDCKILEYVHAGIIGETSEPASRQLPHHIHNDVSMSELTAPSHTLVTPTITDGNTSFSSNA